jgi:uncharacterized repeat protein (TIGR01451 family)
MEYHFGHPRELPILLARARPRLLAPWALVCLLAMPSIPAVAAPAGPGATNPAPRAGPAAPTGTAPGTGPRGGAIEPATSRGGSRTAAAVAATMIDEVIPDLDGDSRATPGDTIRYHVDIENTEAFDATGLTFDAALDANTTLVPGSTNLSPVAFDDVYTSVGNTLLIVGAPPGIEPVVWRPGSVFDNDVEFLGDAFTLIDHDATSVAGATVTVGPAGGFSYLPPAGYSGTDTFTYTIGDGGGMTSTATVTVVVSGRIWYFKPQAPPGGDGRSTAPYQTLAPVSAPGGFGDVDVSGDVLFLHASSYNYENGVVLEPAQQLVGQGVDLVVDPGTGPVTLVTASNRPFLVPPSGVTGVALSSGNSVRGVHVISTDAHGIAGASVGALTIDHAGIETFAPSLDRQGLSLANGTVAVDIDSLVVSSGGSAIVLNATAGSTTLTGVHVDAKTYGLSATDAGTLTVTGNTSTISTLSPGLVNGAALKVVNTTIGVGGLRFRSISGQNLSRGVEVQNTGALGGLVVTGLGIDYSGGSFSGCTETLVLANLRSATISSVGISSSGSRHVDATNVTNGLRLTRVLMDNAPSGVVARNLLGNSLLNSCSITNSSGIHLSVNNDTATAPAPGTPDLLTLSGCTLTGASTNTGALLQAGGGANLRIVVSGGTFSSNGNEGIDVRATAGSTVDLRVSGTAIGGNAGDGIDVTASNTSNAIVDIRNLISASSNGTVLFLGSRDSAAMQVTVDNVGITGSTFGVGIECEQVGNGSLVGAITNSTTSGTLGSGILGEAFGGAGLLSLTVASNQVSAPLNGSVPTSGIFLQSSETGGGTNTLCLNLTGNTSAGSAAGAAYTLRQRTGTTFQLQNFTGSGTSAPAVANWVNSVKGNTGSVTATFVSGFTSSSGCTVPDPLPDVPAVPQAVEPLPDRVAARSPVIVFAAAGLPAAEGAGAARPRAATGSARARAAGVTGWQVGIGTLPAGRAVAIVFDVTVNDPIVNPGTTVTAQGTLTGADIPTVLTDDPEAGGNEDPTLTALVVTKDLGVLAVLAPVSGCERSSAEPVRITIRNPTGIARSGFDVQYSITGPIGAGPIVENVGGLSVPPGGTALYTFTSTADLSAPGAYTLTARTLLGGDSNPANDETTAPVMSRPSPTASAGSDRTVSSGVPTEIGGAPTASGGTGPYTYAWTPAAGLDDPAAANPVATVAAPMTYSVQVTDVYGCQAADSVTLTVVSTGTLNVRVVGNNNDAEEDEGGSIDLTSSDLELVNDGDDQTVGMRFTNVGIPAGATIEQAWIQFTAKESQSGSIALTLAGQAADSAAIFTSANRNISLRPRTTATVAWAPPGWTAGQAGANQRTPEMKTVVQQIVSRPGWKSGNAMVLLVTGTGHRTAYSHDGGAAQAALLHVDYSLPVASNVAPAVDAGLDQAIEYPASAQLDGTASDDGLPNPPSTTTTLWEKASGPGAVTFGDANALDTQASFDLPGVYVLRLTASDGALIGRDSVTIEVTGTSATLERRVLAGPDDAEEGPAGAVTLASPDLQMVDAGGLQVVGMRFANLAIPPGSVVTAAWVQFHAAEAQAGSTSLTLRAQVADNAPAFAATTGNVSSRTPTPASVAWSPPNWTPGAAGADQRTPDLTPVIQAIVSRPGWASGNALALIVTGTGLRTATSYEGGAALAPLLHVEYTAPALAIDDPPVLATGTRARAIPNPARGSVTFELEIARAGPVRLDLFDLQGRRLATVLSDQPLAAGRHAVKLERRLGAGLYFYRVVAPDRAVSGRVLVLD